MLAHAPRSPANALIQSASYPRSASNIAPDCRSESKSHRHSVGIDASVYFGRQPTSRPAHQPCFGPTRATAVLMYADNRCVDHLDGAVVGFREGLHERVPDASHPSTNKPVVAGRVRPKVLRQISPWRSRPQYPEDAVEHPPVVHPRHAARLVRKERPDGSPLIVGEFVSHDSRPRFGSLNHFYLSACNTKRKVRNGSDSGHAADRLETTRMTHGGP
jgi:hypothetical protein